MKQIPIQLYKVIQQLRKQLPIGIWGAKEAVAQWAILRSRKRPERVNRSKQRVEASAIPAATTEIAVNDLLSRTVASQVPSALKSLTSVFGMEQGSEVSVSPVGCPLKAEASRASQPKGRAKPAPRA